MHARHSGTLKWGYLTFPRSAGAGMDLDFCLP